MQLLAQQNQMVFFLELRNYPQVSWLSYINKNPPVLKKKTTPGASGAEHGNAKGVADDRQGPLRCFRWEFRRCVEWRFFGKKFPPCQVQGLYMEHVSQSWEFLTHRISSTPLARPSILNLKFFEQINSCKLPSSSIPASRYPPFCPLATNLVSYRTPRCVVQRKGCRNPSPHLRRWSELGGGLPGRPHPLGKIFTSRAAIVKRHTNGSSFGMIIESFVHIVNRSVAT